MRTWSGMVGWAVALLALVWTASAFAFNPIEQNAEYEVPLPTFDFHSVGKVQAETRGLQVTDALSERFGGSWKIYTWNSQTSTAADLYGSGTQVSAELTNEAQAETVAREFLAANPDIFQADLADLRFASAPVGLGKRTVHFQQTYHGIDVWQGGVYLTFTETGRLFAMGSTFYRGISVSPQPSISAEQAIEIAKADLPYNPETDELTVYPELLVLPVGLSATEVEHHLVWRLRLRTANPLGIWVTHVDAHDGSIVWRYNDIHFVNFTGDAEVNSQEGTYCNGETTDDLRYLRVTVTGVGTVNTDINGHYELTYGGTDARTVTADLYGPYVDMENVAGAEASFSASSTPGTPLLVFFRDSNAQQDERDVFDAVNDMHTFFLNFDPSFGYTNQRINAYVSRSDGYCPGNAWWDGTINLCAAGGGYANTGEIQGVTHHEFCHGIQDYILGWQGDEGLGEGNSDVMANLMTQESIIGRGFYTGNCASGIRDSENTLQYPADVVGQPIHSAGRVIAGFHWDFLQEMQALYGAEQGTIEAAERWHFGRVTQQPTTQPAQVLATFIADDDDGNLDNGTPHYDALCLAATNHGFDCPEIITGVIITHTPLATTEDTGAREAVATITSTEANLNPDALFIYYRVNGGAFQSTALTTTGTPNQYHGFIPGGTQPAEIEYYLYARDMANNEKTDPPTAPEMLHAYDVAWLYDDFQAEAGWTVNAEGGDNATSGVWVRVDPISDQDAQPEDDHTPPPGTICWVTGNASSGQPSGTNDVDGGTTTLYSVVYDLSDATFAKAKYWRWYSNNMGNNPNADTWVVQVRNEGGAWQNIESNQANQNQWVFVSADLLAMFGDDLGNVQFKFVASDLASPSLIEALVDDFEILLAQGASAVDDEGVANNGPRFAFAGPRVNPASGASEIRFETPVATHVRLAVFDVTGRNVRTLMDAPMGAGVHEVAWDGADESGSPVASGLYYVRLQAGEFHATRNLVIAR